MNVRIMQQPHYTKNQQEEKKRGRGDPSECHISKDVGFILHTWPLPWGSSIGITGWSNPQNNSPPPYLDTVRQCVPLFIVLEGAHNVSAQRVDKSVGSSSTESSCVSFCEYVNIKATYSAPSLVFCSRQIKKPAALALRNASQGRRFWCSSERQWP